MPSSNRSKYYQAITMDDNFSDGIWFGVLVGITVVIAVINLIFFIKMWNMTNDVNEIKELIKEWLDIEHPEIEEPKTVSIKKNINVKH